MTCTIAVAGKGGTGKTTVSSLIVTELVSRGRTPVLAVDADPNANLNTGLGVEVPGTLGDLQARSLNSRSEIPAGMDRRRFIEFQLQSCLAEESGFDLLVMGRTEGPGCYCAVNNILREFMDDLMPNYPYAVLDNEAGMEHISRRTTRDVDILLVVSDENPVGIRSAGDIYRLVRGLEIAIGCAYLVVNRTGNGLHRAVREEIEEQGLDLLGTVPSDEQIMEFNLEGRPLTGLPEGNPARRALGEMLEGILE